MADWFYFLFWGRIIARIVFFDAGLYCVIPYLLKLYWNYGTSEEWRSWSHLSIVGDGEYAAELRRLLPRRPIPRTFSIACCTKVDCVVIHGLYSVERLELLR